MRKSSLIMVFTMVMALGISTAAYAESFSSIKDAVTKTNANQTGQNPIDKRVPGQKMHGSYQKNTNSCASCHMTHNSAGKALLFQNTVFKTCSSCHDGTLGYLNVFDTPTNVRSKIDSGKYAGGGTFKGDETFGNPSVHMANNSMKNSAAPGGNSTSTDSKSWGSDFSCASCHSPHGSYSDRLLHYNPNNINLAKDAGGKDIGTVSGLDFVLEPSIVDSKGQTINNVYVAKNGGTRVNGPWLYGYTYGNPKLYWSRIYVGTPEAGYKDGSNIAYNSYFDINYAEGYATLNAGYTDPGGLKIAVAPATVVKFSKDGSGKVNGYTSGSSAFCGSCHTDYAMFKATSGGAGNERGVFAQAYRHSIDQSVVTGMQGEGTTMVCLSCHYAHGADSLIQRDSDDVYTAYTVNGSVYEAVYKDQNASSALKKYINMSACWKCHTESKATQLKNNDGYWENH